VKVILDADLLATTSVKVVGASGYVIKIAPLPGTEVKESP